MFKNLRVATKLSTAFAALVALGALVGGMAIYQMASINSRTVELSTNWLPSVKTLGNIGLAINQIRRGEFDHVLSADDKGKSQVDERLARNKQALTEHMNRYQTLLSNAEDRRLFENLQKSLATYFAADGKLVELSRGGEKVLDQTKAWMKGESLSSLRAVENDLQALIDFNDKSAAAAAAEAAAEYRQAQVMVLGLLVAMVLLATVCAFAIIRSLTRQLGGEPADAAALADRIAQGDLTSTVSLRSGDNASVMANMARMQASLSSVVAQVRENADSVATASAQIAQGNQDLSGRTEQQASALQQTAATMEQLGTTVRSNADNAQQANQLAEGASAVAGQGGEVVGQVVTTMQGINDSSRKIGDIISVIDGIAFQTNILALNAAVEAARAGEQGRGFAVVASEVRSLAQRSADAAKEIKSLISHSVAQVEQGSSLVDQAGKTMNEIVSAIQRVTDVVAEISSATVQQSSGVNQVGDAVSQMDQATQQNAALVEQSAAAAESLKSQAQALVQTVAVFKLSGQYTHASTVRTSPAAAYAAPSAPRPSPAPRREPKQSQRSTPAPTPAPATPAASPAPAHAASSSTAHQPAGDDWETF